MSDLYTIIKLPRLNNVEDTGWVGLGDFGRCSVEDMRKRMEDYRERLREELFKLDTADFSEYQITVVRGRIVEHHVETLQRSTRLAQEP